MIPTALVVIDMQNQFESMVKEATPHIKQLISMFKLFNLPVIFTQHGHTPAELDGTVKNQLVKHWGASGSIAANTPSWRLLPAIQSEVTTSTPVVAKNTYDAFLNTNLQYILNGRNVQRVVICGVMTDCCVDTTARSAFNRGFETWIVEDACGSGTKEQHEDGLKTFKFAFGDVMTRKDVMKRITHEYENK